MLRIRRVQPFLFRPLRANSTSTAPPPPPESDQDAKQAEKLYNDNQAKIFHAIMSNPVNKPFHGNKKLINQARARSQPRQATTTTKTITSEGTEVVEVVIREKELRVLTII